MTCPHEYTSEKYDCDGLPDPLELKYLECLDCGEWLGMGLANDDPMAVAIELRAAEIAAKVTEQRATGKTAFLSDLGCDGAEIAGWIERQYDSEKLPEQPGEHAGYLARCIAEHDVEQTKGVE